MKVHKTDFDFFPVQQFLRAKSVGMEHLEERPTIKKKKTNKRNHAPNPSPSHESHTDPSNDFEPEDIAWEAEREEIEEEIEEVDLVDDE